MSAVGDKLRSIRVRLTLWYAAMLFVGFVVLGGIVWMGIASGMRAATEQRLEERRDAILAPITRDAGKISDRLRVVIQNPSVAATIIPEAADKIRNLETESDREEFVRAVARDMAEGRMRSIANLMPDGDFLEVRRPDGQVVAAPADALGFPWPELEDGGFAVIRYQGEPALTHRSRFDVDGETYLLLTATSLAENRAVAIAMGRYLQWAALGFLLLSTIGGWAIASRALRPVDEITKAARAISIDDLSMRLESPRTGDELDRLTDTWNTMLARLENAVEQLKQFTADASHELRTPTAVIRTTAELALRRERSGEEYRSALEKIQDESGRMTQLVDELLTLARADSENATLPTASMDLAATARDVCADYQVLAQSRQLNFAWDLPESGVTIEGHEESLRRLLVIFLDNAFKYTPSGGEVRTALEIAGSEALLSVRDTGPGIAADELSKIFNRFYRADSSRTRNPGSFGLGLSMAKWIASKHRVQIEVESKQGSGSTFRVRFRCATRDRCAVER